MWNPAYNKQHPEALPIHTVKAQWGSRPGYFTCGGRQYEHKGYAPDWHVMTIQPDPKDRSYPYWVTGWLPGNGRDGAPCCEPFIWKVPDISDARYDLTEAVCLPPVNA